MDSRYIKLEPQEALWIKKNIRISQETFSNILRHLLFYQSLRKKEIVIRNKLRASFSQLKSSLNTMEFSFPEEERKNAYNIMYEKEKGIKKIHYLKNPNNISEEQDIPRRLNHLHSLIKRDSNKAQDEELDEIRKKLEKLQG